MAEITIDELNKQKTITSDGRGKEEIFWLDDFVGTGESGYFIRSDLFKFFEKCESRGLKIVGIKKPKDWNLEVIIEEAKGK